MSLITKSRDANRFDPSKNRRLPIDREDEERKEKQMVDGEITEMTEASVLKPSESNEVKNDEEEEKNTTDDSVVSTSGDSVSDGTVQSEEIDVTKAADKPPGVEQALFKTKERPGQIADDSSTVFKYGDFTIKESPDSFSVGPLDPAETSTKSITFPRTHTVVHGNTTLIVTLSPVRRRETVKENPEGNLSDTNGSEPEG
jgi:LysM repeat protein